MNQHRLQTELHPALSVGDINGDGCDELIVSQGRRLRVFTATFSWKLLLEVTLPAPIERVFVGDFVQSGRESGSAQLLVSLSDGSTQWLASSDDHTELWWGLTQKTFVDEDETAVIGDFDGDGADEILAVDAVGDVRMYEKPNGKFFAEKASFGLGDLSKIDLRGKQLLTGRFDGETDHADLIVIDHKNGQVSCFDGITDSATSTFRHAFTTSTGALTPKSAVTVANIEGANRDGLVVSEPGKPVRLLALSPDDGVVQPIQTVRVGQLHDINPQSSVVASKVRSKKFRSEPGGEQRSDILAYNPDNGTIVQTDARYDPQKGALTYWRAYTLNLQSLLAPGLQPFDARDKHVQWLHREFEVIWHSGAQSKLETHASSSLASAITSVHEDTEGVAPKVVGVSVDANKPPRILKGPNAGLVIETPTDSLQARTGSGGTHSFDIDITPPLHIPLLRDLDIEPEIQLKLHAAITATIDRAESAVNTFVDFDVNIELPGNDFSGVIRTIFDPFRLAPDPRDAIDRAITESVRGALAPVLIADNLITSATSLPLGDWNTWRYDSSIDPLPTPRPVGWMPHHHQRDCGWHDIVFVANGFWQSKAAADRAIDDCLRQLRGVESGSTRWRSESGQHVVESDNVDAHLLRSFGDVFRTWRVDIAEPAASTVTRSRSALVSGTPPASLGNLAAIAEVGLSTEQVIASRDGTPPLAGSVTFVLLSEEMLRPTVLGNFIMCGAADAGEVFAREFTQRRRVGLADECRSSTSGGGEGSDPVRQSVSKSELPGKGQKYSAPSNDPTVPVDLPMLYEGMRADFKAKQKAPLVIDLKMTSPVTKTVRLVGTGPIDQTATVKVPNLNTDGRAFTFTLEVVASSVPRNDGRSPRLAGHQQTFTASAGETVNFTLEPSFTPDGGWTAETPIQHVQLFFG